MAPRKVAAKDRNTAPVMSMVPVHVREQLDQIAEREKISVSSIGRNLLTKYVQKQKVGQQA